MIESNSIKFKRNKHEDILVSLIFLIFTSAGAYIIEKSPFVGWCGIVFFGIGTILYFIQLITNISHLKLYKEGFEQKTLFKTITFKWSDVDKFEIRSFRWNKSIYFEFRDKLGNLEWKSISTSYTIKTQDLVTLMKQYKKKL